ncbi:MJ0042-type zinc finger domain-containing protein [Caulobacter sp. 17J65-9]|uniref:DUF3426 domain-containing protein n=1 Tax=Caulobacter sp. 17J65-9 TaxID=2709382 RepID=UPI0013CAE616|nr:MJ0042-type zinc finger domain-containing protein [Caulobacter sp. 17J65-9]NEX93631.1 DUF3426 domain-containing protein [Caulobacter sp. 17J65-9]
MILTCPACATRYFVDDDRIGTAGRTVRCASCGSAWRAQLEEPLELTSSAEEGAIAREPLSFKSDEDVEPTAPELPKAFRARQQQKRKMREAAVAGVVWAGLASCFMAMFAAAYLFRVDVVKMYPSAAGAYAAVGVPVNPTGLAIEIKADMAADGLPAVVVSGVVRNIENETMPVPPVLVSLLDKGGKKISTRVIKLSATSIAPEKAVPFSVALADPDATTATVETSFVLEKKPAKPAKPAKPKPAKPKAAKPAKPAAQTPKAPASPNGKVAAAKPAAQQMHMADAGLRPARSVALPRPVEARPLPASDPYALDSVAAPALSAPHG